MPQKNGDFHQPRALEDDVTYKAGLQKAELCIKDGMRVEDAACYAFNITPRSWRRWVNEAEEDMEDGFTERDSRLINVVLKLSQYDGGLHHKLMKKATDLATVENNVEMLKFLLERRIGYKKQAKQEVELSTDNDFNFNINVVNSEPVDKNG